MEYIISPIWIGLELLSCAIFLGAFLPARRKGVWQIVVFLLAWVGCSVLVAMKLAGFGKQIWTIAATTAAAFALYRGGWLKHILLVILCFVFNGVIDMAMGYGVCALLNISYTDFVWKKLLYITVATTAKLTEVFLAYLLWRVRQREGLLRIQNRWLLLTVLFPGVSLLMLVVVFVLFQNQKDLSPEAFWFSIVLALANVGILYLLRIMEKRTKDEQQLALAHQQMEIQTKNMIALEESYRAQRKASHEFSHHVQTISDLLAGKQYDQAEDYVRQLQGAHTVRSFAVRTNHPILDILLNQVYQQACKQDIQIEFVVSDLSAVSISSSELVVILSNLFENAIEACEKLDGGRQICCTLTAEDGLYLSIRNTSLPVTISGDFVATTKEPKQEHGFGLPTVCHLLTTLHGEYAMTYADGWFHFVAQIPMP